MPLYDYECPSCGFEKEVQHPMSEVGKANVVCDRCGNKMNKMLSAPTLIGFDDVGRSISKKDKTDSGSGDGGTKVAETPKPVAPKSDAA